MKRNVRVLGVDDAPFRFGDERTMVVGVVVRLPTYVEGVLRTDVTVDGWDATDAVIGMVERSRFRAQIKAILLDAGCLGGFNVVDIPRLHSTLDIPIISVSRERPDPEAILTALRSHFQDWKERYALLSGEMVPTSTLEHRLYIRTSGISTEDAERLISMGLVRGGIPEPIRLAHIIARGIKFGVE